MLHRAPGLSFVTSRASCSLEGPGRSGDDAAVEIGLRSVGPPDLLDGGYDGCQDVYAATFEAYTSWPGRLEHVIEVCRHRTLDPGETLETEVSSYIAQEGLRSVGNVRADWHVAGEK